MTPFALFHQIHDTTGLARYPTLRFEPLSVSAGPRTVVIEYRSRAVGRDELTVELLQTNAAGLIAHSRVYHRG